MSETEKNESKKSYMSLYGMVGRDYAKKGAWETTTKVVRYLCSQIT
jgi:hypothetical protein